MLKKLSCQEMKPFFTFSSHSRKYCITYCGYYNAMNHLKLSWLLSLITQQLIKMLFICTGLIKQEDSFTALLIQNASQCFHRKLLHQNDALLVIKGVTVFCFVSFAVNALMLAQFFNSIP